MALTVSQFSIYKFVKYTDIKYESWALFKTSLIQLIHNM